MGYIDIAIPLIVGLVLVAISSKLIQPRGQTHETKRGFIKKLGYALIAVAVLYFFIKSFGR